jgi:hypothetical protein
MGKDVAVTGVANGPPSRVYIDPRTAQVTGTHGWANVHRFLRQVHTWSLSIA